MKLGFNQNGHFWTKRDGSNISVKKMSDDYVLSTHRMLTRLWQKNFNRKLFCYMEFFEAEAHKRGLKIEDEK